MLFNAEYIAANGLDPDNKLLNGTSFPRSCTASPTCGSRRTSCGTGRRTRCTLRGAPTHSSSTPRPSACA
eukprot:2826372-Prymnesium_polylepis.1